jgi:hypothetical protein
MQAGFHAFQTGQYDHDGFLLQTRTCLQIDWRMMHRTSQKPLMSNLQLIEHLTSYSDSEWESSLSGPVRNQSLHWLNFPFVTVVHLILVMVMECVFLYFVAISQFYLFLIVWNVTAWISAENVCCPPLRKYFTCGRNRPAKHYILRQWKGFPSYKKGHLPPSQWKPSSKYSTTLLNTILFNTPLSRKTPWDIPHYYNLQQPFWSFYLTYFQK